MLEKSDIRRQLDELLEFSYENGYEIRAYADTIGTQAVDEEVPTVGAVMVRFPMGRPPTIPVPRPLPPGIPVPLPMEQPQKQKTKTDEETVTKEDGQKVLKVSAAITAALKAIEDLPFPVSFWIPEWALKYYRRRIARNIRKAALPQGPQGAYGRFVQRGRGRPKDDVPGTPIHHRG